MRLHNAKLILWTSLVSLCLSLPHLQPSHQGNNQTLHQTVQPISLRRLSLTPHSKLDDCLGTPLTKQLWNEMKMDQYLKEYPGGFNLSLSDFADSAGATNFYCGIGNDCNPSQLCSALKQRQDWYALAAAHRFNTFVNQIYEATAYSLGIVSDLSPTMVDDLIRNPSNFWPFSAVYMGILTAWISGTPASLFGPGTGTVLWISLISAMYIASGSAWTVVNGFIPDPQKFTRWGEVIYELQDFENHMQGALSNFTQQVIDSGISTDQGLYGVVQGGNLFETDLFREESEIQAGLELTLKLKSLSHILSIQNAFVTRGSDPCTGDGPNGSINTHGQLSYCDEEGIMMNIVLAGKESEEPVYNAEVISQKYGLSTQLLTQTAWRCQQKYGIYKHPTIVNVTRPYDTDSDCLFNLPVCDLTDSKIRQAKHERGLIEACRKIGHLPI